MVLPLLLVTKGMLAMRSTESRSALTSTRMSLPPARNLPEAILVSAALMR